MALDKDQLDIATKLNAVIDSLAKNASRLESSFETQVATMEKLAAAVNKVNTKQAITDLNSLNDVKLDKLKKGLVDAGNASDGMSGKLKAAAKLLEKKFPTSIVVGVAALTGFAQGLRSVIAMTKGITGFLGTLTTGMFDVAAAIVAIPFKMFSGLIDLAEKGAAGANELMQAIENLRKEFGALTGPTPHAILEMTKSLKGFSDTGLSGFRVFGNLAERIEAFTKLATAMGGTFQRLTKEFEANGGAILAYQKGLGISDEQMMAFGQNALATGQSLSSVLKETTKFAIELGKSFGVDSKVISKDMAKALVDVKHFAGATVKQIAEAATYARKLGVELDKIVGTLDAFETFDTAAENTAKLSQAFGVQVDAFKLMEAQDPASQIDMLRKSFLAAGKSADTMSRQELKLLAQTTGLDEATAKMAFSSQNQAMSLDEIKKKGGEAEKKTLTQAQAMVKLADSIERLVKSGSSYAGFWDAFVKGILGGLQASKEFRGMMMNIRRAIQQVYMIGVQLGRALPNLIPGLHDFFDGIRKFFTPKYFTDIFKGISDAVKKFLDPKSPDHNSIPALFNNLHKHITDFFTVEGPHGKRILEGFKKMMKFMSKVVKDSIDWMTTHLSEGLKLVIDLLTGKESLSTVGLKGGAGATLGFLGEVLLPIFESLKNAWKVLAPKVFELLKIVAKKAFEFLSSEGFLSPLKAAIPAIALALFGPAFARAIFSALVVSVTKGALQMFSGPAVSTLTQAAGKKLAAQADKLPAVGKVIDKMSGAMPSAATSKETTEAAKALGGFDKLKINFASVAKGIAALGLAVLAMFATFGLIYGAVKLFKIDMGVMSMIAKTMIEMAKVFLLTGPIILEAMATGAALSIPIVAVAALAGFAVMTTIVVAMSQVIVGIIKTLNDISTGAGFKDKIDAFVSVMNAVVEFSKNIAKMLDAVKPSWLELISGRGTTVGSINALNEMLATFVGSSSVGGGKSTGLIGLVETIVFAIKQMADGDNKVLEGAKMFADVLSTVVTLAKAMQPPDKLFEAIEGTFTSADDVKKAIDTTSTFAFVIATQLQGLIDVFITKVIPLVKQGLTDDQIKSASAIGNLINSVFSIAQNLVPRADVLNLLRDTIGGTIGRDDQVMNPKNLAVLGQVITQTSDGLRLLMPSVLHAIEPLLAAIGQWHFTDADAATLKYVGPLLQQIMVMAQSFSAAFTSISLANIPTADKQAILGQIAEILPAMFKSISDKLPALFEGLKGGIQAFQSGTKLDQLKAGIQGLTTIVGAITEVSKLKDLTGINNTDDAIKLARKVDSAADFLNFIVGKPGEQSAIRMMTDLAPTFQEAAAKLKTGGVVATLNAVEAMVKKANELDKTLGEGTKINIPARLEAFAKGVGLGKTGVYTITNKDVVVQVNLNVSMDVNEVEKVMVLRSTSFIRDRLNFLTNSQPGVTELPKSTSGAVQSLQGNTKA